MNHKGLQVLMSGSVEVAGSQVPWLSRKSRVSPPGDTINTGPGTRGPGTQGPEDPRTGDPRTQILEGCVGL